MTYQFQVVSDLYLAGRTEDGEDFTAEVYYVVAEDERGNRWAHVSRFAGAEASRDEDGFWHFADVREASVAEANRLCARIEAAGGVINHAHWSSMRPAYGSAAYVAYGRADDWQAEQRERHDECGFI